MSYDLLLLDSYSFHYSVSLNLICHTDRGTQVRSRLPITTDSALPSTALLPSLGTRKRGRVEDYPNGGDLAVLDGEVFGRGNALGGNGVRVVEQQRGLFVAEGGNQRRTGEHLCESNLGLAHALRALQASGWRVTDDVIGDIAHGRVNVASAPRVVVSQGGLLRRAVGLGHRNVPFFSP